MLLDITWAVDPIIFETSFLSPRWYGVLFAMGFVIGFALMARFFKREGEPEEGLDSMLIHMVLGTVIGARLGHVIFYEPGYYFKNPLEIINLPDGGLASHGAMIGCVITLWMWSRKHNKPLIWTLDRMAVPTALGAFFIRMGNLMNHEIVGTVTDVPWAFRFTRYMGDYSAVAKAVITQPRHPVQLYEALSYLAVFFFLLWGYYAGWAKKPAKISAWFLILIFSARFVWEFFKEHQITLEQNMPLHMGQILSLPLIAIGIYLLLRKQKSA